MGLDHIGLFYVQGREKVACRKTETHESYGRLFLMQSLVSEFPVTT